MYQKTATREVVRSSPVEPLCLHHQGAIAAYGTVIVVPSPLAVIENVPVLLEV